MTGGLEVHGPNSQVGASVADDGHGMHSAHIGAEANAASVGVSVDNDTDASSEKVHGKVGLSAGVGGDLRVQWGTGADGHSRYGLGFDAGPVSVDLSTEDPLRTIMGPLGALVGVDENGKQSNLTDRAVAAGRPLLNQAEQKAREVGDYALNSVSDLYHHDGLTSGDRRGPNGGKSSVTSEPSPDLNRGSTVYEGISDGRE